MTRLPLRRALPVALLLLVAAVPAAAHQTPPPGHGNACGDQHRLGAGFFDVAARRVSCDHARWVARRWSERTLAGERPRKVGRFRCGFREDHGGAEYVSVRCVRDGGRRSVRFHWGA